MKKIRTGVAGVAIVLAAQLLPAVTPAAHADPCFFGSQEFDNWYTGARWGDSLNHVENYYAACTGIWSSDPDGTWNGRVTKARVWPRADGGQTVMLFAYFNTAPYWRAHDMAKTYSGDFSYFRRECEWPRPTGDPCTPA